MPWASGGGQGGVRLFTTRQTGLHSPPAAVSFADLADATANLLALEQLLSDAATSIYSSGEQDYTDNSSQVSSSVEKVTSPEQPLTGPARSSPNCSPYVDALSCNFFRELELSAVASSVIDSKEDSPFHPPFVERNSDHNSGMLQSVASVEQQNPAGEIPPSKNDNLSESDSRPTWSPGRADGLHLLDVGKRCKQPKTYILAGESVPKLGNTQSDVSSARNTEEVLSATTEHTILDTGLPSAVAISSNYIMLYSDLELSDDSDHDTTVDDGSCIAREKDWNVVSNTTQSSDNQSPRVFGKREGDHDDEVGSSSQDNTVVDHRDENHSKGGITESNDLSQRGSSVEIGTSSDDLNVSIVTDRLMNASLDTDEACLNNNSSQSLNGASCEQNNDSGVSEHIPHGQKYGCLDAFPDSGVSSCSSRTSLVNDMREMLLGDSSIAISLTTDEGNARQSQQCPALNGKSFWTDLNHTSLGFPLLGLTEDLVTSSSKMCNQSLVRGSGREVLVKAQIPDSVVKASFNSKALSAAETCVDGEKYRPLAETNGIKLQQSNMTPKVRAHLSKEKFNTHHNSILDLMCTRTMRGKSGNCPIIPSESKNIAGETSRNYLRDTGKHSINEHMDFESVTGTFSGGISPRDLKDRNLTRKRALEAIAFVDARGGNLKKLDTFKESSNCTKSLTENELNLRTSKVTRNAHAEEYVSRDITDNSLGHIEERLDLTAEDEIYIKYPTLYVSSNTTDCKQFFLDKAPTKKNRIAEENNFAKLNGCRATTDSTQDPVQKLLDFKPRELKNDNGAKFVGIKADGSQDSITNNLDRGFIVKPVSEDCTPLESFECNSSKSPKDSVRGHCDWKNESFQISNALLVSSEKCSPKFMHTFLPESKNPAEGERSMNKDDVEEGSSNNNSVSNGDQRDTVTLLNQSAGKITQSFTEKMHDEKPSYFSPKNDLNEITKGHTNLLKTPPSYLPSTLMAATSTSLSRASENCVGPQNSCISSSKISGNTSNDSVMPCSTAELRLSSQSLNSRPTTVDKMIHSGRRSVNGRKIRKVTENLYQTEMYDIMCTRNKRGRRRKHIIKMPVQLNVDTALDKAINKDSLPVQNEADRRDVDVSSDEDIFYVEPEIKDSSNIAQLRGSDKICSSWQMEKAEVECDGVVENAIKTCKEKDSFTTFVELKKQSDSENGSDTFLISHYNILASSIQPNRSSFPNSDFGSLKSIPNMTIQCKLPTITFPGRQTLIADCKPSGALSSSRNSVRAESRDAAPLHLASQTGKLRPRITKPDVYEDRSGSCETSASSAGVENAQLTKSQMRAVTDSVPVLDECDANDSEQNSGRELKRLSYGLRASRKTSYADYSPGWESEPQDTDLNKKTCPISERVSTFRLNKKSSTRKASMKRSSKDSHLYSDENEVVSTSLPSMPFTKCGEQNTVSDCTIRLVLGPFDSTASDKADFSDSRKVEDRMMGSDLADKSLEAYQKNYSAEVIPAFGYSESADKSGKSTNVLKNFSSGVEWKFLPPKMVRLQLNRTEWLPAVHTSLTTEQSVLNLSSQKQPFHFATSSQEQPNLPTTSSQELPVISTQSGKEYPVISTQSGKEYPVISTQSGKEYPVISTQSSKEYPVIYTSSCKEYPVIYTSSCKEQPIISTLSSKDQPILPTTPNKEKPVILTPSSKEQPVLSPSSSKEKPVIFTTPSKEIPVLSSTSNQEQPPLSTIVSSEHPAISSTSITEQSVLSKTLNKEQTAVHIASHHGQEYITSISDTEQSVLPSCPERAEFAIICARNPSHANINLPIMSSLEHPTLLTILNNKQPTLMTSVNQEQTTFSASSKVEKAVQPILSNSDPSILRSTSINEENILIVSCKVPYPVSTSVYERHALHVSPSKEELPCSVKRPASKLSSYQDRGLDSLEDQTAPSNLYFSSHVHCSPKRTSDISCTSNPQTSNTSVNKSETNDILMPPQILQPSLNGKEHPLLSDLPRQLKFDSVKCSTDHTFLLGQAVKTPKRNSSSATTNVNIHSNSKFTHLGSIISPAPPSCEEVMDVILPEGYAIVKLDDQGEPCDVAQSILAKIKSRFSKHCNCLDDEADLLKTKQRVEVMNCARSLTGNVTSPGLLRTSIESYSIGCNGESSNSYNLPSAAVGTAVYSSSAGNVSELGLTANEPQNHIADRVHFLGSSGAIVARGLDSNADSDLVILHDSATPVADQGLLFQLSQTGFLSDNPISERTFDKEVRVGEVLRSEASLSEAAEAILAHAATATGDNIDIETRGNMSTVSSDENPIHDDYCMATGADAAKNSSPDAATMDTTSEVATTNCSTFEVSSTILIFVDAGANDRKPMTAKIDSSPRTAARDNIPNFKCVPTTVVGTGNAASKSVMQEVPLIHRMHEATVAVDLTSDASKDIVLEASDTNDDAVSRASFSDESDELFMTVVIDSDDCIYEFDESSEDDSTEDYSTDTCQSSGDSVRVESELKCSTEAYNLKACMTKKTAEEDVHGGQNFDTNLKNLMISLVNHAPVDTCTTTKNVEKRSLKEPKNYESSKRTAGACSRAPRGRKRKVADVRDFEACPKTQTKKTKRKLVST